MKNNKLIFFLNLMFFQVGLLESMMSTLIPEISNIRFIILIHRQRYRHHCTEELMFQKLPFP